jgi:hypothetical protein
MKMKVAFSLEALLLGLASIGVVKSVITPEEHSKRLFGIDQKASIAPEKSQHVNITKNGTVSSYVYSTLITLPWTKRNET